MRSTITRLVSFSFIFAFVFGSPSAYSQADFSAAIGRVSKSVVVIQGNNGLGSGFIVSQDGKIATNLHVIQDMVQGGVQLANGEIFDSFSVVGVDARRDLAIIKVAGFNLPSVDLGDSESMRVGEPVAVVGSARGLSGTVTTGVLSAIRPVDGQTILQIDAAVNPGNSGGPMIRLDGTVVGVVVAKLKGAENLNFAVPINSLRGLLGNLTQPMTLAQLRDSLKGQTDLFSAKQEAFPREWKSLQTIATRRLTISSDTITGENHLPPDQVNAGFFSRWNIKKVADKWVGKMYRGSRCRIPASFFAKEQIKACSSAWDVELTLVSPTRIEGRMAMPAPGAAFDCATCTFSTPPVFNDFTWVPAD